jgi:hypothetical protein
MGDLPPHVVINQRSGCSTAFWFFLILIGVTVAVCIGCAWFGFLGFGATG